MERLYEFFNRKLDETPNEFVRYKYADINWEGRAFGLIGPRGVGKSTLLLQHIKKNLKRIAVSVFIYNFIITPIKNKKINL